MLQLSQKQHEYIDNADHRWNLKVGAVRSGKSFVDVAYTVPARLRAGHGKDGLNVILGVSRETIERNVLQPMRERYTSRLVGTINARNIARICGEDVYCLGAEKITQVAKIQGSSIKYAYGDEIAKWNREVFYMLQSRLDKPYSCFDGSCNPEYPNHWLKEFIDRKDIDLYLQPYTIFDNPFLPKGFVDALCNEYQGTVYYQRYILGEWALAEGLIYPMWQDAIAEPPAEEPAKRVLSIDYGTMNAFSAGLWGLYSDGVWYREAEYYYSGREEGEQKTDEEYADALGDFVDTWVGRPDNNDERTPFRAGATPDRKIRVIIDPSAASFIALLRKKGRYHVLPADNAVLDGIRETATCLQTGKAKVSSRCKNWIREVQGYVWDEDAQEDRPLKDNDHAMDDMRYFIKTMRVSKNKNTYRSIL